jgi:hypothetical protein
MKTYSVKGNRTAADVVEGREETIETGYTLEEAKIAAIQVQKTGEFVAAWIEEEEASASPRRQGIDRARFAAVVATAKAQTTNKRWLAAIDKAVAGVVSGWWIITELADCVAVTTETGKTYFANGVCQCEAFKNGQPCKHRALARLLDLYNEGEIAQTSVPANSSSPCTIPPVTPHQPRVVRSVEQDFAHRYVQVVRCEGWAI